MKRTNIPRTHIRFRYSTQLQLVVVSQSVSQSAIYSISHRPISFSYHSTLYFSYFKCLSTLLPSSFFSSPCSPCSIISCYEYIRNAWNISKISNTKTSQEQRKNIFNWIWVMLSVFRSALRWITLPSEAFYMTHEIVLSTNFYDSKIIYNKLNFRFLIIVN